MAVIEEDVAGSSRMLRRVLGDVRRRIRAYVFVEGLALTIAAAGLGFWSALGLDRLFEPHKFVRWGFVAVAGLFAAWVFVRKVLARVFVRLSDRNLALVVERNIRGLDEALMTAIELEQSELPGIGQAMLAASRSRAAMTLGGANVEKVFNPLPRRRAVAAALLLAVSITTFALAAPHLFRLGLERLAGRTDELWPRRTGLSIVGFENGERVVAVGSDVLLEVRADTKMVIPTRVDLYYRTENGERDQAIMDQEGKAGAQDPFQAYKFKFQGVAGTLRLDIYGGDARLRNLKLRVVERPRVSLKLACTFPPYTRREPATLEVTGTMPLPQGTNVTIFAECQKPLHNVVIGRPDGRGDPVTETIDMSTDGRADGATRFRFDLGALMVDTQMTFDLHDADGIDNRMGLVLQAVADVAPKVNVARKAVETSVTAQARVPLVGKISDDYGLERLWFDYSVDGGETREAPFAAQPAGLRETVVAEALELPTLFPSPQPLIPGQMLSIIAKALDGRDLPDQPKGTLTAGDAVALTVVTDAEMLRLLEAREIMLREQFKLLIAKVLRDRDSLVGLGKSEERPAGADGEEAFISRDRITVDQARSHTKENRTETLVVADGFTAIVEELVNNRIPEGEQLQERLSSEVVAPLRRIATEMFPDYEARLTELQLAVQDKDPVRLENARREALRSADAILVQMNAVLNKMLELESFKEAVDLLRSIIAMQKDLSDQTKDIRKNKLLE